MAFAAAVDDAEEFKQCVTSLIVTAASVAWLFLLFVRSVDLRLTKYRKLFNGVMSLQLLFAMLRNLSTLLLSLAKDNVLGEVCQVTVNFELAVIMQYIKILPECVILFFFMEQIITLHRGSKGIQDGNNHWRRGLINPGITFLVIVSEIMVGLITIRQRDYLLVTYSMMNVYQATLVVFTVEDTRTTFRKRNECCEIATKDILRVMGQHHNHRNSGESIRQRQ
ncbi:hypothetical protein BGZ74_003045 [Mortierella antarctica]|nr:hypothetical protein BGZ74_003045 [Mortierella antarctica]